jgi:thioredoxin
MISLQAVFLALTAIGAGETVLLDFQANWCGPCRQMAPTIDQLAAQGYPIRKVNVDQDRQLAAQYQVQGIPCFVLLVDGREVDRMVGAASSDSLKRMFAKAGVGPGAASAPAAATPRPALASAAAPQAAPPRGLDAFLAQPLPQPPANGVGMTPQTVPHSAQAQSPAAAGAANTSDLIAASVRLKIEDATGNSFGSGTIIDTRGDQALVLTCGHIFRDSGGKGRILIDMFGPGAPRGLEGSVVGYDLDRDVGLISFRPGVPVHPVRLGGADIRIQRGQQVISIGCDNGSDPSPRPSRVTAIDKYLGPPNLEVAGQPVQGRSGGGLFDSAGTLIGVCNAADPTDDEGLYAALPSIHALLDREGLSSIYRQNGEALAQATAQQVEPLAPLVSVRPPQMPANMPQALPADMPLTSSPGQFAGQGSPGLSPNEQAALDRLRSQSGAEVICVIRSLEDPRAKSQIIVLDRASPAFLQQLALEQERQGARRLTSLAGATSSSESRGKQPDDENAFVARPAATLNWLKPGAR